MRADPTACLLVEELLGPGHGAHGQRRTGRAEPLSFRDPLERRPQAAPAHASLQGHRSSWHWRCVVAADAAHVPAGVAGVALEHLVRVVIPSAPDAAVVRLLLGAAAHADHPPQQRLATPRGGGAERKKTASQTDSLSKKTYTARQQAHEMRARRIELDRHTRVTCRLAFVTRRYRCRCRHAEVPRARRSPATTYLILHLLDVGRSRTKVSRKTPQQLLAPVLDGRPQLDIQLSAIQEPHRLEDALDPTMVGRVDVAVLTK